MKQIRTALGGGLLCFWVKRRRVDPSPAIVDLDEIDLIHNILAAAQGVEYSLPFRTLCSGRMNCVSLCKCNKAEGKYNKKCRQKVQGQTSHVIKGS